MSNTAKNTTETKTQTATGIDTEVELNAFDAMEANEEAQRLKTETKGAIAAMRVYYKGKMMLSMELQNNYEAWRDAEKKARDLTERYIKQCERPKF